MERLRTERDAALREIAQLRSERDEALKQATDIRETAAELRGELTGLRGHVVSVEIERDRWHAQATAKPPSLIERIWGSRTTRAGA